MIELHNLVDPLSAWVHDNLFLAALAYFAFLVLIVALYFRLIRYMSHGQGYRAVSGVGRLLAVSLLFFVMLVPANLLGISSSNFQPTRQAQFQTDLRNNLDNQSVTVKGMNDQGNKITFSVGSDVGDSVCVVENVTAADAEGKTRVGTMHCTPEVPRRG